MWVWAELLVQGKVFYRHHVDIVVDILQDPVLRDYMDYHAAPLFADNKRIFGPFSSNLRWEELQEKYPDRTVICLIMYSDETEFYKGVTAHPFFGNPPLCQRHPHQQHTTRT